MKSHPPLIFRGVELDGRPDVEVLVRDGRVAAIQDSGAGRLQAPGAELVEGDGGALIRGLNDHHLHLYAAAAADQSVACGAPEVSDPGRLGAVLRTAAAAVPAGNWLRGVGYDDEQVGDLTSAELDALMGGFADRPTRISHRSGHAWLLNTAARVELGLSGGTGLLLDADDLLRERLGGALPSLSALSSRLAGTGVTGVTDAGVNNGPAELAGLRAAHDRGELLQRCLVLGSEALPADPGQEPGPVLAGALKIVLAEHDLPGLDDLAARITAAGDRGVAIHAASLEALALATVALRATGRPGQRVEHASIAPPDLVEALRQVRARVVTQPGFVARHGDRYLRTVPAPDQPWLYRLAGWLAAGVPLAAGSDSPYGPDDPWIAMVTATSRLTADGRALGPGEALTPEQALSLFTSPLSAPGTPPGPLRVGDRGDLCLLRVPWRQARRELSAQLVAATVIGGQVAWSASR